MSFYFKISQLQGQNIDEAKNQLYNFLKENCSEEPLDDEKIKKNLEERTARRKTNLIQSIKSISSKQKLIGGLDPEVYISPPKKFQESWIFYIPRCDFKRETYKSLLPIIDEKDYIAGSYGKLLPESYYYGILKKIKGKYYIDLDTSKFSEIIDEKILEIYRVANSNGYISDNIYPETFDKNLYLSVIDILVKNPDKDWSLITPSEYQFIYGGISGFQSLLETKSYIKI